MSDAVAAAAARKAGEGAEAAWQRTFMLVVLPALAVFAYCIFDATVLSDGDTNWQVAAGRWILAHGAAPTVDPFSFTMAGRPWVTHEWGAEVLLALAFQAGGWAGVMTLTAGAAALAFAVLAAELAPRLGVLGTLVALGLAFALALPLVLARPHMLALPLLAIWLAQLLAARRRGVAPAAWLVALMLVWANLHGSYVFGLAFLAAFALEAVLDARGRRLATAARWGGLFAACVAAAALTPNGLAGLVFPVRVMLMTSLGDIGEWRPIDVGAVGPFEVALLAALAAFMARGARMGAVRLLLLMLLVHMTMQHMRQLAILAIAGPLLVAEPLGRARGRVERRACPRPPLAELAAPLAVAMALFAALAAWRFVHPVVRQDEATTPVTALAHVPPGLARQPVFNDYSFGGWLIFSGVRPFIDGRADMYGDAWVQHYLTLVGGQQPDVDKAFKRWNIAWAIVSPKDGIVHVLDARPGWKRLYSDPYAVLFAREDALATPAAPPGAGPAKPLTMGPGAAK